MAIGLFFAASLVPVAGLLGMHALWNPPFEDVDEHYKAISGRKASRKSSVEVQWNVPQFAPFPRPLQNPASDPDTEFDLPGYVLIWISHNVVGEYRTRKGLRHGCWRLRRDPGFRAMISVARSGPDILDFALQALQKGDRSCWIRMAFWNTTPAAKEHSHRLSELFRSKNVHHSYLALGALRGLGAAAIPSVSQLLADPDPKIRSRAIQLVHSLPFKNKLQLLEALLQDGDAGVRKSVYRQIAYVNARSPSEQRDGASVVFYNFDSETRENKIAILHYMHFFRNTGSAYVPDILRFMENADTDRERSEAIAALGYLGAHSNFVRALLLRKLRSSNREIRTGALWGFSALRNPPDEALHLIIADLSAPDRRLQRAAVWALYHYGPRARSALPKLERMRPTRRLKWSLRVVMRKIRAERTGLN